MRVLESTGAQVTAVKLKIYIQSKSMFYEKKDRLRNAVYGEQ
jgi:hypothetical protein